MSASSRDGTGSDVTLARLAGLLLVGGASSRMGRPKHLLEIDGQTFVERLARAADGVVERLRIGGAGELPPALAAVPRLADVPGVGGPLAGLLSAFAHDPDSAWLALACDQPFVSREALAWLVAERRSGAIAVLPRLDAERVEPFPAIYEPAAYRELAALAPLSAGAGSARPLQRLAAVAGVRTPRVPEELASAFAGANDPGELGRLLEGRARP